MAIECDIGETVRITAADLTHTTEGAVTAGAVVTVNVYNPDGTLQSGPHAASNGGSGDDWFYDITAPSTPGQYVVKVTAVKSGATAKDKLRLTVRPF